LLNALQRGLYTYTVSGSRPLKEFGRRDDDAERA
jgi:hypothetical protein